MTVINTTLDEMLQRRPVAVVGASGDRSKYGNIVLRNLRERGWEVFAVNPRGGQIEDAPAYASLADCPERPGLAVIVTPPEISVTILKQAPDSGVEHYWLQPGAESPEVLRHAEEAGLHLVYEECIMVQARLKQA